MTGTPALEVRALAVRLGGTPVLRGVDLEIAPGEVVGLLGRNGAGKTTLLRALTRVLPPDEGAVRILGRPLESFGRRELARAMAIVPQETPLPFPFRVGELVLMGRFAHLGWLGFERARDVEAAEAALARVGLLALADRSVQEVSGGERQLAVVARALAQDPALLLLDEPTAFLDLRHRLQVLEAVRDLAREGRAALVVSHDLALVSRFCDRLALLAEGRVLAAGTPAEVLQPPLLRRAFGIEAWVTPGPDGSPIVVPRAAASVEGGC